MLGLRLVLFGLLGTFENGLGNLQTNVIGNLAGELADECYRKYRALRRFDMVEDYNVDMISATTHADTQELTVIE